MSEANPAVWEATTARPDTGVMLLATRARLRRLATATLVGPDAAQPASVPASVAPEVAVQMKPRTVGPDKLISVMECDPWFATTAMPVAVLIATEDGWVPTV